VATIVKESIVVRNLTKTIAVASLMLPVSAYPLGIGDIQLHSALNQNLNAEISLELTAGEKIADVKVSLAPSEKFIEAGVPWNSFLAKIKFETVLSPNGKVLVKLSSREALKEPFLDLMLEVSWPKGNLYREFTVLVDPPATYEQPTIPVANSIEDYQPRSYYPTQSQTVASPQARTQRLRPAAAKVSNGYLMTNKNDTLWGIAQRANTNGEASVEQMMIAIYQQNPSAFFKQNVNALVAGKKLKIPESSVVLKLSKKEALAEFSRQISEWKNGITADSNQVASHEPAGQVPENELTLHAPAQEAISDKIEVTSAETQASGQKTLEKPASLGAETTADATENKSAASSSDKQENTDAVPDAAIQTKIAELEKQLATMQQILALKDQQLAILQNKPQAETKSAVDISPIPTPPEPKPEGEIKPQPPKQVPIVAQPVAAHKNTQTPSESYYYLGVLGIGTGLLTVLGWLWLRNRRLDREAGFETLKAFSVLSKNQDAKASNAANLAQNDFKESAADTLFLADFVPGEFDTFDMDHDEIDPISEADVYLAYGRYLQAEELIRHAIADQPERDDYKLKLLEIFYSNNNHKAFESYAWQLADAGKKDDRVFWSKVVEMGGEICTDCSLFNPNAAKLDLRKNDAQETANANSSANLASDAGDVMFSEASLDDMFQAEDKQKEGLSGGDLFDFDLSFFEDKSNERSASENRSLEFDTVSSESNLEETEGHNPVVSLEKLAAPEQDKHSLSYSFEDDFDFELDEEKTEASAAKAPLIDLTNIDEVETKLDLAIAYIDMGDTESAIEIATEVLEKGNENQVAIAKSLLEGLK
jgi:pilus assembly protein FimV